MKSRKGQGSRAAKVCMPSQYSGMNAGLNNSSIHYFQFSTDSVVQHVITLEANKEIPTSRKADGKSG